MAKMGSSVVERNLEVGGLLVHLSEFGEGPPLLVLHHSTGPMWSAFYDSLGESFTVTAPDMPGYGQSTRPVTARTLRSISPCTVRAFFWICQPL